MYIDVVTVHFLWVGFIHTHWINNTSSKHSLVIIGTLSFSWYDLDWFKYLDTVSSNQKVNLNFISFADFTQYWFQVFPFFEFLWSSYFIWIYWKLILCVCCWKIQSYFLTLCIRVVNFSSLSTSCDWKRCFLHSEFWLILRLLFHQSSISSKVYLIPLTSNN